MDSKDLWIGDQVRLIKSQRIGKVVKIEKNGKIIIESNKSKITTNANNIEIYSPEVTNKFQEIDDWLTDKENINQHSKAKKIKSLPGSFIDLHFEKLDTNGKIILEQNILEFKMNTFKEWFEKCYTKRYATLTVIHGKGTGTLKSVLESWLKTDQRVQFIKSINDDGALEIWLKYH